MATAPAPIPRRNLLSLGLNFVHIGQRRRLRDGGSKKQEVNINGFSIFSSNLGGAAGDESAS